MRNISLIVLLSALTLGARIGAREQAPDPSSLVGTWTLNRDLSDNADGPQGQPGERPNGGGAGRRGGGPGGGSGGGFGGRGGGGFGGRGGFGGGSGGGRGAARGGDPGDMRRQMEAMRDLMMPADRLTIVQADETMIVTSGDGRTTRLSPNGKSIKEENTGIERKTKWDSGRLVSEISGLPRGKITETYSTDPDTHRLRLALTMPPPRGGESTTMNRIYDRADPDTAR